MKHFLPGRYTAALLVLVCVAPPTALRGEDSIFKAIVDIFAPDVMEFEAAVADPAMADQFTPILKKILNTEIHFVRKVCRPNKEQLEAIHAAGMAAIGNIAQECARLQQKNVHGQWPDARKQVADALMKKVEEALPAETVARYKQEMAARAEGRKSAALGMMMVSLDRKLMFSPQQFEKARETVDKNWEDKWSRNLQVFGYDDYAPRPPQSVLGPLLNETQQEIWSQNQNYGQIYFGWEQEIGWMSVGNGAELEQATDFDVQPAEADVKPTEKPQ